MNVAGSRRHYGIANVSPNGPRRFCPGPVKLPMQRTLRATGYCRCQLLLVCDATYHGCAVARVMGPTRSIPYTRTSGLVGEVPRGTSSTLQAQCVVLSYL